MSRMDQAVRRALGTAAASVGTEPTDDFGILMPPEAPVAPKPPRAEPAPARARAVAEEPWEPQAPRAHDAALLVRSGALAPAPVEQYRRLAAALHQMQAESGARSVMVSSAVAGEGKTLTAANLAITLSESYRRRVVVIDADLRRPRLHELLGAPNHRGLREALETGGASLPIRRLSATLSCIPAGRAENDPLRLLTSAAMRQAIMDLRAAFDWVVIDTRPVALLPDASLLAGMVDVALLVVAAGRTPCALVQRAVAAIGRERLAGVVLNRADRRGTAITHAYNDYYHSQAAGRPRPR